MVDTQSVRKSSASISSANIDAGLRAHMNKVYALMSIGLFLTGGVAYIVGNNETLVMSLFTGMSRWVVMFAPLVVVFAMGSMINRLRASTAQLIFYAFSALMGLSISYIFMIYTSVSIAQTFFSYINSFCRFKFIWLHNKTKHLRNGKFFDNGRYRINCCVNS